MPFIPPIRKKEKRPSKYLLSKRNYLLKQKIKLSCFNSFPQQIRSNIPKLKIRLTKYKLKGNGSLETLSKAIKEIVEDLLPIHRRNLAS